MVWWQLTSWWSGVPEMKTYCSLWRRWIQYCDPNIDATWRQSLQTTCEDECYVCVCVEYSESKLQRMASLWYESVFRGKLLLAFQLLGGDFKLILFRFRLCGRFLRCRNHKFLEQTLTSSNWENFTSPSTYIVSDTSQQNKMDQQTVSGIDKSVRNWRTWRKGSSEKYFFAILSCSDW